MKECMKILIKHINFPVFPVPPSARFSVFTLLPCDVPYDIKSIRDQGDTGDEAIPAMLLRTQLSLPVAKMDKFAGKHGMSQKSKHKTLFFS